MKLIKLSFIAIALSVFAGSCKKDDGSTVAPKVTTGVYVLGQGNYGSNNTTLTYYDFGTQVATTDYFYNVNGFHLGDTGSDFLIYGGKLYIVMNVSGYVAIANDSTAAIIDTVSFTGRGPQNIVGYGNHVFVSTTDGDVCAIDTATYAIAHTIAVGTNPAQLVVSGTNLYVSNSGGFNAPLYDSTVSVIDLNTFTETGRIKVGINPGSIAADNLGNIYVACAGNFGAIPPSMAKVNIVNNTVIKSADTAAGIVRYYNGNLYTTGGYGGNSNVRVLSTTDFSAIKANFISDGTVVETPYGLDIDNSTGDVYVGDAKDYVAAGEVFCFDKNGNKKFSFSTTPTASPVGTVFIQH